MAETKRIAHGALRGAIASMAMSGLREVTTDRVALIADHLLYGFVLSETRSRPRD
jgi:hypothetical protein